MNAAVFDETVRRHLQSAGYIAFVLLVAAVGLFAATFNKPASMWPTLIALLALVTGAGLIGPEFSTGTLQLIVTKPVRRPVYLLSRVAGVFAGICLAAAVGLCAEGFARMAWGAGGVPWQRLFGAFAGAAFESLLTVALLALLGSLTRAYFNVAIYLGAEIALSISESVVGMLRVKRHGVGAFIEAHPGIERGLASVGDVVFAAAPPEFDWIWVLRVVATAAVALLLACLAFQRREVPYSAD